MTTMLEKAAQAIGQTALKDGKVYSVVEGGETRVYFDGVIDLAAAARAALEAIREPNTDMLENVCWRFEHICEWHIGIDAILEDQV